MLYQSKSIMPGLVPSMLNEDDDTLRLVATCRNMPIAKGNAPLIGRYLKLGNQIVSDTVLEHKHLQFHVEFKTGDNTADTVSSITIGSKFHGLLLVWTAYKGWVNMYRNSPEATLSCCCTNTGALTPGDPASGSLDDIIRNYARDESGYSTLDEAIDSRDYCGGACSYNKLTEGQLLLDSLKQMAAVEIPKPV